MGWALCALLWAAAAAAATTAQSCSWTDAATGAAYDLAPLVRSGAQSADWRYVTDGGALSFYLNVCANTMGGTRGCAAPGVAQQVTAEFGTCVVLGQLPAARWALLGGD